MPSARPEAGLPVSGICKHQQSGDEKHPNWSYPRMLMIGTGADFRPMPNTLSSWAQSHPPVLVSVEEVAVRFGKVGSGGSDVEIDAHPRPIPDFNKAVPHNRVR